MIPNLVIGGVCYQKPFVLKTIPLEYRHTNHAIWNSLAPIVDVVHFAYLEIEKRKNISSEMDIKEVQHVSNKLGRFICLINDWITYLPPSSTDYPQS